MRSNFSSKARDAFTASRAPVSALHACVRSKSSWWSLTSRLTTFPESLNWDRARDCDMPRANSTSTLATFPGSLLSKPTLAPLRWAPATNWIEAETSCASQGSSSLLLGARLQVKVSIDPHGSMGRPRSPLEGFLRGKMTGSRSASGAVSDPLPPSLNQVRIFVIVGTYRSQ